MVYKIFILSLLITSTIASSLNATAPRSQECYENGTYSDGALIQISRQYSAENCANHCASLTNCNYFTYDPTKQMCEALYNAFPTPSTYYCPDCISGRRSHFCGAHGYCEVCTFTKLPL